jgi:hypothetical protein
MELLASYLEIPIIIRIIYGPAEAMMSIFQGAGHSHSTETPLLRPLIFGMKPVDDV